jgi:hypothetical protein
MVTCQAQTSSPAARVWAYAPGVQTMMQAAMTNNRAILVCNGMMRPLL